MNHASIDGFCLAFYKAFWWIFHNLPPFGKPLNHNNTYCIYCIFICKYFFQFQLEFEVQTGQLPVQHPSTFFPTTSLTSSRPMSWLRAVGNVLGFNCCCFEDHTETQHIVQLSTDAPAPDPFDAWVGFRASASEINWTWNDLNKTTTEPWIQMGCFTKHFDQSLTIFIQVEATCRAVFGCIWSHGFIQQYLWSMWKHRNGFCFLKLTTSFQDSRSNRIKLPSVPWNQPNETIHSSDHLLFSPGFTGPNRDVSQDLNISPHSDPQPVLVSASPQSKQKLRRQRMELDGVPL